MILEISSHNRQLPGLSVSGPIRKWCQNVPWHFFIFFLTTGLTVSKFYRTIHDTSPQNQYFDFSISSRELESILSYVSYEIELKLCRLIILVISSHDSASDFRFPPHYGARLLKSSNRFTAYNFYPIELKFGKMILEYQSAQSLGAGFSDVFPGALWGRASRNF